MIGVGVMSIPALVAGLIALALSVPPSGAPALALSQGRGVPVTIASPANDFTTLSLVSRLLADANVPYRSRGS